MSGRNTCSRADGLTLVELIVIVAVLAIVAAMVTPRIGRADSSVLRMAADQVAADFRLIQSEAMAYGDSIRVLDWQITTGGRGYTLMDEIVPDSWGSDGDGFRLQNNLTNREYRVEFGVAPYEHLEGVWLAKSNFGVGNGTSQGIVRFGRYGQVLGFDDDPVMILAAGDSTLRLTLDRDLGEVTIASDFGRLADIGGESLPGPSSWIYTSPNPPD
ncbi:MAG: prepilin-type N-terminal cleavage/methylation domain-containing protein [Planctomycetota bacterium]